MPNPVLAIGGAALGSVGSAAIGSSASKKAAQTQAAAADRATQASLAYQDQARREALGYQQNAYDRSLYEQERSAGDALAANDLSTMQALGLLDSAQARALAASSRSRPDVLNAFDGANASLNALYPAMAGNAGNLELMRLMGLGGVGRDTVGYGSFARAPTGDEVRAELDPALDYYTELANKQLDRQLSQGGLRGSGTGLRASLDLAKKIGDTGYMDAYNRVVAQRGRTNETLGNLATRGLSASGSFTGQSSQNAGLLAQILAGLNREQSGIYSGFGEAGAELLRGQGTNAINILGNRGNQITEAARIFGQGAANSSEKFGANASNITEQGITGAANAQAAGTIGSANAIGGAFDTVGNLGMDLALLNMYGMGGNPFAGMFGSKPSGGSSIGGAAARYPYTPGAQSFTPRYPG